MEKISIGTQKEQYEIKSIRPTSQNVLQIVFAGEVPTVWGDITLYTEDGTESGKLPGYGTVYRNEGQTVYLSNDGSVYEPQEKPEEVSPPEPYEPTVAELQSAKKAEIAVDCQRLIYGGVNVTLEDRAVEHFSLTEHDQLNLFGKQSQLITGAKQLEYHADGQPCRYYTAAEMMQVIQTAMWHVSYHTTYCNAINMWIAGCETVGEVQSIFYGADVPAEYQSEVLQFYLDQIAEMAGGADAAVV